MAFAWCHESAEGVGLKALCMPPALDRTVREKSAVAGYCSSTRVARASELRGALRCRLGIESLEIPLQRMSKAWRTS